MVSRFKPCTHVSTSFLDHSFDDPAYPSHPGTHDYTQYQSLSLITRSIPIKSHLSDFGHIGAFWTPCVITRGLSYFDLSIRVSFRNILPKDKCQYSDICYWDVH